MRKKMYKKGKFWVVATITTSAIFSGAVVQADEVEQKKTENSPVTDVPTSVTSQHNEAQQESVDSSQTPVVPANVETSKVAETATVTIPSHNSEILEQEKKLTDAVPTVNSDTKVAEKPQQADSKVSGTSTFRLANQSATSASVANTNTPSFVDVSSHNGTISVAEYRQLAQQGVAGVVVKLTEGTHYKNPYAASQIKNAQDAGMKVSAYAYSHYTNENEARQEARYFAKVAKELNLPTATVMVNDMEEAKMKPNINQATKVWTQEMKNLGFNDVMYYAAASWLDNTRWRGPIKTAELGVHNFWVAQYPAQKLSDKDARSLNYHSGTGAWQFTSKAELLKGKHVFDQSLDYTGRFTNKARVVPVASKASATLKVENINHEAGTYDVVVRDIVSPDSLKGVSLPSWSSKNGGDDVVWHTAVKQSDGSYRFTVRASEHKGDRGLYHTHAYLVSATGKLTGVGGVEATLKEAAVKASATLKVENINHEAGTYDVVVRDIVSPDSLKGVSLPSWSAKNGGDDVVWHTAVKQSDGSYRFTVRASEHKGDRGLYHTHAYLVSATGKLTGVGGIEATLKEATVKASATLKIENINHEAGTYDVVVRDIVSPDSLKGVSLPSWSAKNGGDDLVWHTAVKQSDGSYRFTVRASEHKGDRGLYHTHAYLVSTTGKLTGVGGVEATLKEAAVKASATLKIENINHEAGTYDVVVRDIVSPDSLKGVSLPSWSAKNGGDDVVWHTAVKQSDGSYRFTVRASEHKGDRGLYHTHAYLVSTTGKLTGVGGVEATLKEATVKASATLKVENINHEAGTYDVVVRDIVSPDSLKGVSLPSWSAKNGGDDVVWHTAVKQSDGSYRFTVRASEHKGDRGLYHTHAYLVSATGKLTGVGGVEATLKEAAVKASATLKVENINHEAGTYDVVVRDIVSPDSLKGVSLPSWSAKNGGDDVVWHTAVKQSDGSYRFTVRASEHKGDRGLYHTHAYLVSATGKLTGVGGVEATLTGQYQSRAQGEVAKNRIINAAASLIGVRGGTAEHARLVNDYNSVKPLPVGYAVKHTDDWCDIFVTVLFQRQGLSDLIGRECGVERHINIFKHKGIWNEDGSITPQRGDIITFNWNENRQPNNGWADHIGIVEKVENGIIHTIEGNSNNVVKRNQYSIGHGNIRGFARPNY